MKILKWSVICMGLLLQGLLLHADDNARQFILIGVDGLSDKRVEKLLAAKKLPNFAKLMSRRGKHTTVQITGHTNPATAPGNAEFLSGLSSKVTGIVDNTCDKPLPEGASIFERLKSFDSSIRLGLIYGKSTCYIPDAMLKNAKKGIEWWQTPDTYTHKTYANKDCADANDVAAHSQEFLADKNLQPFFLMVYFGDTDCAGHKYGNPSPEYDRAVQNVDHALGILLDGLAKTGVDPKIIISADHGWNEGTAGHKIARSDSLTIPLISNEAGLLGVRMPAARNKQCDIAPTILSYFGMQRTDYDDIYSSGCSSFTNPE